MSTAIWHLLAEILGEKGSAKQLLTATGFIYFLQILIVPFYLLATFWPTLGIAVVTITTICLAIWSLYLQIAAISVVYHMSMAKACLILFLPILIFIGVVIIMVISLSSFFISAANEFLVNPPQF